MSFIRNYGAAWLLSTALACVCSAQGLPSIFSSDAAAKVTQLNGQVSVLKDSTPWALQVGSSVQVRQVIITGADGFAVFQVSDGSTFEVYPNSRVVFRANPSNLKDLLDLVLGRVKVHIQKLGGQPNNNRVTTPTAVISVRGTVFDVMVEDQESTLVAVEEGLVEVRHALIGSSSPKLVNPGESLRVYRDQPLAQRSSPVRDATIQQGLRAAAEALYRIVYRTPTSGGSPLPGGGTGGAGGGHPGDTDSNNPPPPPPPPPPSPLIE
jgi:hypothetical protein